MAPQIPPKVHARCQCQLYLCSTFKTSSVVQSVVQTQQNKQRNANKQSSSSTIEPFESSNLTWIAGDRKKNGFLVAAWSSQVSPGTGNSHHKDLITSGLCTGPGPGRRTWTDPVPLSAGVKDQINMVEKIRSSQNDNLSLRFVPSPLLVWRPTETLVMSTSCSGLVFVRGQVGPFGPVGPWWGHTLVQQTGPAARTCWTQCELRSGRSPSRICCCVKERQVNKAEYCQQKRQTSLRLQYFCYLHFTAS